MNLNIGKPYITDLKNGKVRLNSDITCSDAHNELFNHTLYYEVESAYKDYLCTERIDAFVLGLLGTAMNLNCNIKSSCEISEKILYQLLTYYIPVVSRNFKDMHNIKIDCVPISEPLKNKGGVVTGNSGGVDSFYTIVKYKNYNIKEQKLTHLIFDNVCTEDYDESRIRKNFYRDSKSKREIAEKFGLNYIEMYTNLYSFYPFPNYIFNYFFTASYSSCVYALEKLFSVFYFSSGLQIEDFSMDEKSITDAAYFDLFTVDCISSESLKIYSAGAEVGRLEKTREISDDPVVQEYLQVDTIEEEGSKKSNAPLNCGRCQKCLRTISSLYALGKLEKFSTIFDLSYFLNNKGKAFARTMAGEHSIDIGREIYLKMKNEKKIPATFYLYYPPLRFFVITKKKLSKVKILKKMYYKSGIAAKVHARNGETIYDEYYKKYGKFNTHT